ncbi:S-4TM family putative pore-forming effector [Acinetobacter bereziniae]|uniref:S-4TM family putative pore-forming effector n=1 Tax=Acinetobacter bereziniae TaxID=106648 RepID=UPI00124FB371|nr:S-4TM family putative pore-forming effector [Acinetobacter bereziniae]
MFYTTLIKFTLKMFKSLSIFGVILPLVTSFITFALNNDFFSNLFHFNKTDIGYISAFIGIISTVYVEFHSQLLKKRKEDAAKIQEKFDTDVFQLSWDSINVGSKPDTGLILRKSKKFNKKHPFYDGFENWYTSKAASFKYPEAIIFCQQQNLYWDSSLRKDIVSFSKGALILIVIIILVLGLLNDFTFRNFLTNVVSLLLPIGLFFYKIITEHNETIQEMNRLRDINESLINSLTLSNPTPKEILNQCRQLQTAIYNHRKSARPIPNWLHKIKKSDQEEESADRMKEYLDSH